MALLAPFQEGQGDTRMVQTQNLCDYLKPETTAGKGPRRLSERGLFRGGQNVFALLTGTEVLKQVRFKNVSLDRKCSKI